MRRDTSPHLLGMKTKTEYTETMVTASEVKKAARAADTLLERARRAHAAAGG
jgi:hypothetical protein